MNDNQNRFMQIVCSKLCWSYDIMCIDVYFLDLMKTKNEFAILPLVAFNIRILLRSVPTYFLQRRFHFFVSGLDKLVSLPNNLLGVGTSLINILFGTVDIDVSKLFDHVGQNLRIASLLGITSANADLNKRRMQTVGRLFPEMFVIQNMLFVTIITMLGRLASM